MHYCFFFCGSGSNTRCLIRDSEARFESSPNIWQVTAITIQHRQSTIRGQTATIGRLLQMVRTLVIWTSTLRLWILAIRITAPTASLSVASSIPMIVLSFFFWDLCMQEFYKSGRNFLFYEIFDGFLWSSTSLSGCFWNADDPV